MLLQVFLLLLAIIILYFGAEFALESAEKIGVSFGFSPLVIGLLIVGFGTSLPEFFVSQLASYRGQESIALGNIVGSNIANLFLILGISGILTTLNILRKEIKIQFIIHFFLTAFLAFFLLNQKINLLSFFVFLIFFICYMLLTFKQMKQEGDEDQDELEKVSLSTYTRLIVGFSFLYCGGELLVSSGTKIGELFGISTYIISAIFVAFGTSFPELVTAILACIKKKDTELIVGNIIGSNIFNVAFVLGSLGFYNITIKQDFKFELILLFSAALYLILINLLKKNFSRFSGVLFLGVYISCVYRWISIN